MGTMVIVDLKMGISINQTERFTALLFSLRFSHFVSSIAAFLPVPQQEKSVESVQAVKAIQSGVVKGNTQ